MRAKVVCLLLLIVLASWAFASGIVSCRIDAANGPATVSSTRVVSRTVLKVTAFDFVAVETDVGKVNVKPFQQTGMPVEFAWKKAMHAFIALVSFLAAVLPMAYLSYLAWQPAPTDESEQHDLACVLSH